MTGSARTPLGRRVRWAMAGVSILCLGWVLWPIWRHARELGERLDGPRLLAWVGLGVAAYVLLSGLLALAWWWLAGIYGRRPAFRAGYAIFARAQIAKYLPGNAFHFVSRQVLGSAAGLSHPALVASSVLEMGSLLLAALLTAAAGAGLARASLGGVTWLLGAALGMACLAAWPAADSSLRRLPRTARWMEGLPHLSLTDSLRLLGPAVVLHVLFFLGAGVLLLGLVAAAGRGLPVGWEGLLWVYPVAWTAGTVSVGAPAGVGVREAILTLELESILGPATAAVVALAFRLVTLGGDLLTALVGWSLRPRS